MLYLQLLFVCSNCDGHKLISDDISQIDMFSVVVSFFSAKFWPIFKLAAAASRATRYLRYNCLELSQVGVCSTCGLRKNEKKFKKSPWFGCTPVVRGSSGLTPPSAQALRILAFCRARAGAK